VITYLLLARVPDHTRAASEYLLRPETMELPDFDPSGVVEFRSLVS